MGRRFLVSLALVLAGVAGVPAAEEVPRLAPRYRAWLDEVAPILTDAERAAFLALTRDFRRDAFIERFWQERDPYPETRKNEFLEEWKERLAIARERYRDPRDPRRRLLMLAGEPQRVERQPCPQRLRPLEFWLYWQDGDFTLVFVSDPRSPGGYRLWSPLESLSSLALWSANAAPVGSPLEHELVAGCPRGAAVVEALRRALDWEALVDRADWLRWPSPEWASAFVARSTELPPGASALDAQLALSFPGRYQSRTVVQGVITVPREETPAPATRLQFVVDGEILRQGRLFESFRYRFDLAPGDTPTESVPLVFHRRLRPGRYTALIRVHELHSDRYQQAELELTVPRLGTRPAALAAADEPGAALSAAPPPAPAPAPPAATPAAAAPATAAPSPPADELLAEANRNLETGDYRLTLRIPPGGPLTGVVRVTAQASGEAIAKVAFALDGRPVMAKSRPPYSVELNLGHAPRLHRLEAIAYDRRGREIARDEVPLNAGPHRFAVRLIEPREGGRYRRSLRASAEVDLPLGMALDRVEFYLDEDRLATLYQAPFVQPILLPPEAEVTYVRAVAYLEDGNSTEDLVFINAPSHLDHLEVDFVELYTTVLDRRGRPVEGLTAADFEVLEDGRPQRVRRFELVRDLPIHAGVLIDASTSMEEEIDEVEQAALKFFQRVIQPKDRAAVIVFNDMPSLEVPLTNSHEVLAGALADLQAEGETALYDSIVYGVFYFSGVRGKRALVLLTDGQDSSSRHSFSETLDFARRSGIAVYSIGLSLSSRDFEVRTILRRLARETGGESFFIDRASQLDSIYARIEEELRSQYLLGYQSEQGDADDFREVEVRLQEPGLRAKTIPGYYPQ